MSHAEYLIIIGLLGAEGARGLGMADPLVGMAKGGLDFL